MWIFNQEKVREIFQELEKECFFINEVENPLYAIEGYIKSSETALISNLNKVINEEEARVKYEEENYPGEEIAWQSPTYFDNIEVKNLHYISIFIFLYSFLERKMKKLSDLTEKKYKRKKGESYLFEFKMNLELSGINFQKMETEWNLLDGKYRDLRNDLVHDDIILKIEFPISNNKILIDFMKNTRIFLRKIYYENFEN